MTMDVDVFVFLFVVVVVVEACAVSLAFPELRDGVVEGEELAEEVVVLGDQRTLQRNKYGILVHIVTKWNLDE